jgi:hypothetical protein
LTLLAFRSALGLDAAAPGNPPIGTLTDPFDTLDPARWEPANGGPTTTTAGTLSVAPTLTYPAVHSIAAYSLAGSAARIEIAQVVGRGSGSMSQFMLLASSWSPQTGVQISGSGGGITAHWFNATGAEQWLSFTPYDATAMRWWQIRESAGTIYFEVGPDGVTWPTTLATVPTATVVAGGLDPAAVRVSLGAGFWGTETAPDLAVFDNLNAAAAAAPTAVAGADTATVADTAALAVAAGGVDTAGHVDAAALAAAAAVADTTGVADTAAVAAALAGSDAAAAAEGGALAAGQTVTGDDTATHTETATLLATPTSSELTTPQRRQTRRRHPPPSTAEVMPARRWTGRNSRRPWPARTPSPSTRRRICTQSSPSARVAPSRRPKRFTPR